MPAMPAKPVLHGDNGSTLKATTVLVMLHWLGVKPSYSRPRVSGEDVAVLAARHQTYLQARERNPARWSGNTRNWSAIGAVTLDLERDTVVRDHLQAENIKHGWPHESGDNHLDASTDAARQGQLSSLNNIALNDAATCFA